MRQVTVLGSCGAFPEPAASVAAARPAFGGDVLAAEEGLTVEIGDATSVRA
ncbi:hypothetical protein [Microbispora siamensis]|nr:hypothetical protein [Microbispora siamensis]